MEPDTVTSPSLIDGPQAPVVVSEARPLSRRRKWTTASFWVSGIAVVLGVVSVAAVTVLSPTALVGLVFISFPLGIIAAVVGFVGIVAGGGRQAVAAAAL